MSNDDLISILRWFAIFCFSIAANLYFVFDRTLFGSARQKKETRS